MPAGGMGNRQSDRILPVPGLPILTSKARDPQNAKITQHDDQVVMFEAFVHSWDDLDY